MAGVQHLIEVPDEEEPWPVVFEVAGSTPAGSWVLVGGLMVHVHALRAGITPSRPTSDVDLLVDVVAVNISAVAGPLQSLGFRPATGASSDSIHRFIRDGDVVDVMVERGARARWAMKPVFAAPAARQAIERSDRYELRGRASTAQIAVPDALGALVAKAAAYEVDSRDRRRHLEDIAVLLASSGGARRLQLERLTSKDRQHLRPAFGALGDDQHDAWSVLDDVDRVVAYRVRDALSAAIRSSS